MALQIPDPLELEKTIELLVSDPSGSTWARIKQANTGEDAQLSSLWAKSALEWDDQAQGKVRRYTEVSRAQVMAESVRLTLLECNIADDGGDLLFPKISPNATRTPATFHEAWAKLPIPWALELYEAVLKVNPQWGRGGDEGEASSGSA